MKKVSFSFSLSLFGKDSLIQAYHVCIYPYFDKRNEISRSLFPELVLHLCFRVVHGASNLKKNDIVPRAVPSSAGEATTDNSAATDKSASADSSATTDSSAQKSTNVINIEKIKF